MSDDFEDLEAQLREAHAFAPREGLREEVRASLRPARVLPWAGFSAAAAVLLAVVGVGFLLHSVSLGPGGASTAANPALRAGSGASYKSANDSAFGPLPQPPSAASPVPAPAQLNAGTAIAAPGEALVYRASNGTLTSAPYRVAAAPAGAKLLYVAVQDGSVLYFEPVYVLPDGTIETALTPGELRG